MKHYFLLLAAIMLLGSCTKTEYISNPPELQVYVTDNNDNSIKNASVSLFGSREDWDEKTDKIDSLLSDSTGYVLFQNLSEKQYFVFVEKDSLTNAYGVIGVTDSLQNDEIRILNIKIEHIK